MVLSAQGVSPIREVHPSSKGGLYGCRGSYQDARGGTQVGRTGGLSGAQPGDGRSQLYTVSFRPKAETSDVVVKGKILVYCESALT